MYEIVKTFAGWLHTVKDPVSYLGAKLPYMLFSESDLQWPMTETFFPKEASMQIKEYDLIMNAGSPNVWHEGTKNWTLAVSCFEKLIDAMPHLKILVVGREPPDHLKGRLLHVNFIEFPVFLTKIARSKILFVPSYSDASPRVITQALYLNTSIVVNEGIIGGWKYVNNETGASFIDENDIVEVVKRVLAS